MGGRVGRRLAPSQDSTPQNKSKQNEMLVAAAAVGVATVFAAPFSGETLPPAPAPALGFPRAPCGPLAPPRVRRRGWAEF